MKPFLLLVALLAAIILPSASARATALWSPPIEVGGDDWDCLECLVANVSDDVVKVGIRAYAEDGASTDLGVRFLDPGTSTSTISHCEEDAQNFSCRFYVSGSASRVRASACEFNVSLGCAGAASAR